MTPSLPKPIPERNVAIDPPGGVVRDDTQARAKGRWWDCDKIRFRNGRAEVIGGWTKINSSSLGSAVRSILRTVWGKSKAYIVGCASGLFTSELVNLNPTHTIALGNDPIFINNGVDEGIKLTVPSPSVFTPGQTVTLSGLTAIGANTTAMLNRAFVVQRVFNGKVYLRLPDTGSMDGYEDGSGGGSGGQVSYTIAARSDYARQLRGSRYWSLASYGLDVVSCERNGSIMLHRNLSREDTVSYSSSFMRASSLAKNFPAAAIGISVGKDRSVVAFGSTPIFYTSTGEWRINRRLVRWSDNQDPYDWEPREDNTAGEYEILDGSEIVGWLATRREHLIFLDAAVWSMRWVGAPYYYSFDLLMPQVGIIGPNAVCAVGDTVYWMGHDNFYAYNGSVRPIPSAVGRYVFARMNRANLNSGSGVEDPVAYRVCCGVSTQSNEVWWHYPSGTSTENDSYVIYNYVDNVWSIGSLNRSAMIGLTANTVMGDSSGDLYLHENGFSANGSAIAAHLESGDMDLGEGELVYRTKRLIPDLGFVGTAPTVTYEFKTRDYPMGTLSVPTGGTASTTVTAGTEYRDLSIRARQVALRLSSSTTAGRWFLGRTKVTVQPDGGR